MYMYVQYAYTYIYLCIRTCNYWHAAILLCMHSNTSNKVSLHAQYVYYVCVCVLHSYTNCVYNVGGNG